MDINVKIDDELVSGFSDSAKNTLGVTATQFVQEIATDSKRVEKGLRDGSNTVEVTATHIKLATRRYRECRNTQHPIRDNTICFLSDILIVATTLLADFSDTASITKRICFTIVLVIAIFSLALKYLLVANGRR